MPPYGTAAFFKEKQRIKGNLFEALAWLLIGLIFGAANLVIIHKYADTGLGIPTEHYFLGGLTTFIVSVYLPRLIQMIKELRSLIRAYFQYLERFRLIFGTQLKLQT